MLPIPNCPRNPISSAPYLSHVGCCCCECKRQRGMNRVAVSGNRIASPPRMLRPSMRPSGYNLNLLSSNPTTSNKCTNNVNLLLPRIQEMQRKPSGGLKIDLEEFGCGSLRQPTKRVQQRTFLHRKSIEFQVSFA